jgi:hypothetical protein
VTSMAQKACSINTFLYKHKFAGYNNEVTNRIIHNDNVQWTNEETVCTSIWNALLKFFFCHFADIIIIIIIILARMGSLILNVPSATVNYLDDYHHSHRRGNLKSYVNYLDCISL